jgi:hypothetical protein
MLRLLGAYAVLVVAALLLYASGRPEVRSLATVVILGPCTLIRPWVVAAATADALRASHTAATTLLTIAAATTVLAVGKGLDWWYGLQARRRVLTVEVQ